MVTMKITGGRETRDALTRLQAKVAKKVMRTSLREGCQPLVLQAKTNAPRRSGEMVKNLKIRAGKRRKSYLSILIGTAKKGFTGKWFYSSFQEFGWKQGSRKLGDERKQIEGKHYTERAYQSGGPAAVDLIMSTMRRETELAAKEAAREAGVKGA